ncbi:RAD51-associated protein 1 isoform X2 [Peromyscus eremicus]|uniref:RAD51-associated protein 1 isoform X2 n=1 Tax=Peromyscus eremicus TaxID=42410 RepID=UPI0027DE9E6F|nr:RAD51-associated protein 1 isoform X2 [Peromyscus eremicus]
MVRPARNKKPVNYSQFEDSGGDSDDDFISSTMHRNKKPKTVPKELKQDKPKPSLKNLQKEDILPEKAPKKRVALDDKVFQRGLEVALALSVKELPTVTNQVQKSQEKSTDEHSNRKAEITEKSPPVSNCSGTSDNSGLDRVVEEGDTSGVEGEEKASSKAAAQRPRRRRRALSEGSEGSDADDAEPDSAADEDSENDSNFDESEESDEEFAVRKRKVKGTKKKAVQRKPAVGKEKKWKHKCEASVTSVDMAPAAIKSDSPSLPEAVGLSSEATRKPAKMCSPSAEGKRPKWVPPAASGSRSSSSSPLAGAPTKSPSQSLRLGLSRLAPVKRLHPNATSSQVR